MRRGYFKLYCLQRLGEWASATALGVIAVLTGGDLFLSDTDDLRSVILGLAALWGGVIVLSGWLVVSALGLFAFRKLSHAVEYAFVSTFGAFVWLAIWLPVIRHLKDYPLALYAYLAVCLAAVYGVAWLAYRAVARRES